MQRRAQVTANYNVVLYFGDNPGDYKGAFDRKSDADRDSLVHQYAADFGNRLIVLPNPVYGEWVRLCTITVIVNADKSR